MENIDHYSDEDFQNYLDHDFKGDVPLFEGHLAGCEHCNNILKGYQLVKNFVKDGYKITPLNIDLATSVSQSVFEPEKPYSIFERVMYILLILFGVACTAITVKFMIAQAVPVYFLLLIIPAALYFATAFKEIKLLSHKFNVTSPEFSN